MTRPTGFSLVVRALVRDRAKDFNDSYAVCEIMAICQGTAAEAVHHRRARGAGGSRRASTNLPANGLATCNRCHEWVESNREKSRGFGWLLLQNQTPSEVPVLRRGVFVLLDNDGGFRPVAVGVDPNQEASCPSYYPKWSRHCDKPPGHGGRHWNACVSWTDEMAGEAI